MSRPFLKLDENLIKELAGIGCTTPEIASILNCGKDTIERNYAHCLEAGRANVRMSIRREQYHVAMDREHKGQVTMLVWLGKILCDQWEVKSFLSKLPSELLRDEIERRDAENADEAKPAIPAIDLSDRVKAIKGQS